VQDALIFFGRKTVFGDNFGRDRLVHGGALEEAFSFVEGQAGE
jgi:hypothetical protein